MRVEIVILLKSFIDFIFKLMLYEFKISITFFFETCITEIV